MKNKLLVLLILTITIMLFGCKTKHPIVGSYKNGKNIIEINRDTFVFKSYGSFEGYYYSKGKCLYNKNVITLLAEKEKAHVDFNFIKNELSVSEIQISDFDYIDFNKLQLVINLKYSFNNINNSIELNDKIELIQLINIETKSVVFEKKIQSDNYKVKINIGDIANAFLLDTVSYKIKKGCIINLKSKVKFKKVKI
jgi:hypothetical protein